MGLRLCDLNIGVSTLYHSSTENMILRPLQYSRSTIAGRLPYHKRVTQRSQIDCTRTTFVSYSTPSEHPSVSIRQTQITNTDMHSGTIAAIVIGSIMGVIVLLYICRGCCMCIGLCWAFGGENWYRRKCGRKVGTNAPRGDEAVPCCRRCKGRAADSEAGSLSGDTVC